MTDEERVTAICILLVATRPDSCVFEAALELGLGTPWKENSDLSTRIHRARVALREAMFPGPVGSVSEHEYVQTCHALAEGIAGGLDV